MTGGWGGALDEKSSRLHLQRTCVFSFCLFFAAGVDFLQASFQHCAHRVVLTPEERLMEKKKNEGVGGGLETTLVWDHTRMGSGV